jgi:hypothetical protein
MVENTSFTGSTGCEMKWSLTLKENTKLHLFQDAGSIEGKGKLSSLNLELAAGNVTWKEGAHPVNIQLSAGNLELINTTFPETGKSQISIATGNASLSSPKGSKISTVMSIAAGNSENSFKATEKGHLLEINIALGNGTHSFY